MEKGIIMATPKQLLETRHSFLKDLEGAALKHLSGAPDGTLRISRSQNRTQFYWRRTSSDRAGKYISKKIEDLAKQLAQKEYDKEALLIIRKELEAIESFMKEAPSFGVEDVYERLDETRKGMVIPIIEPDELFVKRWAARTYTGKGFDKDAPELYTDKGERGRSKSEMIIANMLLKSGKEYHYE